MLTWIKKRTADRANASELYGRVVTQARLPWLYAGCGVPDTTEGRFEMLVLHLWLAVERLRTTGPEGNGLARLAIESFVTDMDDCMREMGVGDLTVPKKVKGAAAVFYARTATYRAALADETGPSLAAALRASLGNGADAEALAGYVRDAAAALAAQPEARLVVGDMVFPGPPERRLKGDRT